MTSLCWWLYDGDWFQMLVAESLCWRFFSSCWWFSQCVKSVTNILNRSLTSQTCHQHIWSPTSVTIIDLTDLSRPNPRNDQNFCTRLTYSKSSLSNRLRLIVHWPWFNSNPSHFDFSLFPILSLLLFQVKKLTKIFLLCFTTVKTSLFIFHFWTFFTMRQNYGEHGSTQNVWKNDSLD